MKKIQEIDSCNILNVNINILNLNCTKKLLQENIKELKGEYICVSNVHTTVMSYEDEDYKKVQNEAILRLPDGAPLSIISRIKGFKNAERVTGPDLMRVIFEDSDIESYTHYFYGSKNETLKILEKNLLSDYPKIKILGKYSPPFRQLTQEEDRKIVEEINSLNPDFVWVGLGAPKQEKWMNQHKNKINGLMVGVGAGFDYFAGSIKRAPNWMQKLSLEWLYRLMQEPNRLFKRYFVTNSKFIYFYLKDIIRR